MNDWVRCADRFPSDGHQVLCCYIQPILGVPSLRCETMYFDESDGWRYWSNNKNVGYPVTHWRELPEPPAHD